MKKALSLLIVLTLCLMMCACGETTSSTSEFGTGHLTLNSEMIDMIKDEALNGNELTSYYKSKILSQAEMRISSGYYKFEDMSDFTHISSVTSSKQSGDCYYHFYCKLYGTDTFNRTVSFDMYVSFYCDPDSNGNPTVVYDGFAVD